jgi:hypothetical protein
VVGVEVTTPVPTLEVGFRFTVLGDECRRPHGFGFTGELTGRPPLVEESGAARRRVGSHVEDKARTWTDADRVEARRLWVEGLSWSQIAERVCGDKRYKSTVQVWLRPPAVARNGDGSG